MWAAARHINYVQHTNFEGGKTAVKAWPYVENPAQCTHLHHPISNQISWVVMKFLITRNLKFRCVSHDHGWTTIRVCSWVLTWTESPKLTILSNTLGLVSPTLLWYRSVIQYQHTRKKGMNSRCTDMYTVPVLRHTTKYVDTSWSVIHTNRLQWVWAWGQWWLCPLSIPPPSHSSSCHGNTPKGYWVPYRCTCTCM